LEQYGQIWWNNNLKEKMMQIWSSEPCQQGMALDLASFFNFLSFPSLLVFLSNGGSLGF
jgi:hypothetical protein